MNIFKDLFDDMVDKFAGTKVGKQEVDAVMLPTREEVVAEARTWVKTPYHEHGMIKGVGVDCGLMPYAVYRKFALIPEIEIELLQSDWFCHTTQEKYLLMIQRHLRKILAGRVRRNLRALPGSLACARVAGSKVFNHSGIVTQWPMVIHASRLGVMEVDASNDPMWNCREVEIYDPWSVE